MFRGVVAPKRTRPAVQLLHLTLERLLRVMSRLIPEQHNEVKIHRPRSYRSRIVGQDGDGGNNDNNDTDRSQLNQRQSGLQGAMADL